MIIKASLKKITPHVSLRFFAVLFSMLMVPFSVEGAIVNGGFESGSTVVLSDAGGVDSSGNETSWMTGIS